MDIIHALFKWNTIECDESAQHFDLRYHKGQTIISRTKATTAKYEEMYGHLTMPATTREVGVPGGSCLCGPMYLRVLIHVYAVVGEELPFNT